MQSARSLWLGFAIPFFFLTLSEFGCLHLPLRFDPADRQLSIVSWVLGWVSRAKQGQGGGIQQQHWDITLTEYKIKRKFDGSGHCRSAGGPGPICHYHGWGVFTRYWCFHIHLIQQYLCNDKRLGFTNLQCTTVLLRPYVQSPVI